MTPPKIPPSVDETMKAPAFTSLTDQFGRRPVVDGLRATLDQARSALQAGDDVDLSFETLAAAVARHCHQLFARAPRPVFNLTGTVLHTNLGRAPLAEPAIEAVAEVARGSSTLEFDLARGRRGERDHAVAERLKRLTGAEAALVVNNNAAAVLLVLNTLALRKEVPVSRGELIEIGGAFRMPDIMARAGCRLIEVGTTNRTHLRDFEGVMGPRTAMLMKVHTSNYVVQGFTANVPEPALADLAHDHDLPFVVDLGSGTLVDLTRWRLPKEPTVSETLSHGADLVTFSGDKLLGGPQAGLIAGRADLIARLVKNPMKRAMRADKMTLAALDATLALYEDPDSLPRKLPALRLLTRKQEEIADQAERVREPLSHALGADFVADVVNLKSQIGSGALPVEVLPSTGLAIKPVKGGRGADARLRRLAAQFRALPRPVIGALRDGSLLLDLRCLDDEARFTEQLADLGRS